MPDKFAATWVSHSSMSDFLKCPRAYFLNNVYRDPKTNHKIQIVSAPLTLGQAVHEVVESLSTISTSERFKRPLLERFEQNWQQKYSGKRGGFTSKEQEQLYKERGAAMLRRIQENPGPVARLAVKIKTDLPQYWLSESDEIILCGKIDWLEYLPELDAVHILDFKTGKKQEDGESLQLPIYHLLVHNTQARKVAGASYWYLETSDKPVEMALPDLETAHEKVLAVAKQVRLAKKLGHFKCPQGEAGCFACKPREAVLRGEGEFIGESEYRQDMYILKEVTAASEYESEIL